MDAKIKQTASFDSFTALDIRVGQVLQVEEARTKKPTYKITVDFGPHYGTKVTCGAYRNYSINEMVGRYVIGILNLGIKKMGPELSEFLLLGVPGDTDGTIFLTTERPVKLGSEVF
jgi:tRNA-binding protein